MKENKAGEIGYLEQIKYAEGSSKLDAIMIAIVQAIVVILALKLSKSGLNIFAYQFINITQSKPILESPKAVWIPSAEEIFGHLTQSVQFTNAMKPLAKFPRIRYAINRIEKMLGSKFIMSEGKKAKLNITAFDSLVS